MNTDYSQSQFYPYVCSPNMPPQSMNPTAQNSSSVSPSTPISPLNNPATPLSPSIPSTPSVPLYPPMQQGPPPVTEADYIPGYLSSNIGRNVKAEFIVGSSQYVEKTGKLIEVGVNFFVLQDINSRTNVMCDLYSVRFVTILYA